MGLRSGTSFPQEKVLTKTFLFLNILQLGTFQSVVHLLFVRRFRGLISLKMQRYIYDLTNFANKIKFERLASVGKESVGDGLYILILHVTKKEKT